MIDDFYDGLLDLTLGQQNDKITRAQVVDYVNRWVSKDKYKVVCDETNNTPDLIDANSLRVNLLRPDLLLSIEITMGPK